MRMSFVNNCFLKSMSCVSPAIKNGLGSIPMERWTGLSDTWPLNITFLLSTFHKIPTLNKCITSCYEGAINNRPYKGYPVR